MISNQVTQTRSSARHARRHAPPTIPDSSPVANCTCGYKTHYWIENTSFSLMFHVFQQTSEEGTVETRSNK